MALPTFNNQPNPNQPLLPPPRKRWYKRWWGILLISLWLLILAFVVWFLVIYFDISSNVARGEYDPRLLNTAVEPEYEMAEFIDLSGPRIGLRDAPIQIVEFGDFLCPVCQRSYSVVRELTVKYPDKVAVYWRDYPVTDLTAIDLAKGAECAHQQDKFWPMHDRLFQMQGLVDYTNLMQLARQIGLDEDKFYQCFEDQQSLEKIKQDFFAGEDLKIAGTPTFLVNGYKLQGHVPMEAWEQILASLEN
jgi:protein-disulfide isomerase